METNINIWRFYLLLLISFISLFGAMLSCR